MAALFQSSLWWFGLLLGMRHALEPDHLAAVSTLVGERRGVRSGAMLGTLWGLGHTFALLIVASVLAVVGAAMPARLGVAFEMGVAVMLVALGARSLLLAWPRAAALRPDEPHAHAGHPGGEAVAEGEDRAWGHAHARERVPGAGASRFGRRSVLVGVVHGLAGSGSLTALLASQLPSTSGRLLYVALFGFGSIVGMAALSGAAGWPLARLGRRPAVARAVLVGTGFIALGLGVRWGWPLVHALVS